MHVCITLLTYAMSFDRVNLEKIIFCTFNHSQIQNLNKKYITSVGILKVHYLVKKLSLRLIKSGKNYRSCYLNNITAVLYFSYINVYVTLSNELIGWKKFSNFLMGLDCYPQNESISHLGDYQKYANICFFFQILFFRFAQILPNFWWLINRKLTHFPANNQDSLKKI